MMDDLSALAENLPDEVIDYIADLETRVVELSKRLEATPDPEPKDEGPTDPIAKALEALPEELATFVKEQSDRLTTAEKALETARVEKADAEWVAKARKFDGVIDKPEEFGPKLRAIADANPELASDIEAALSAASARTSELFVEKGHAGVQPGSVVEKVESIAKALVDADPKLTMEEARASAWEHDPDLYEQYVTEQRARARS